MERKDVAELLNSQILKNAIGSEVTVDENLDAMADYGKAISEATKTDFLDFYGHFISGVIEYNFGLREYKPSALGILKSTTDYMGIKERIKNKELLVAIDSPVGCLEDGKSYIDGKFSKPTYDIKIYTKWDTFRLKYSIEDTDSQMKQRFSTAEGVMGLVALIQNKFKNTLTAQRHEIEKRALLSAMVNASKGSRVIDLKAMYNSEKGTSLTVADCLTNDDFQAYALNVMADVKVNMTEGLNEIYNDGSVITFTPKEDLKVVALGQFVNACKFNVKANTYNESYIGLGDMVEVPYWQNRGTKLAARIGQEGVTIADISTTDGASEDPTIYSIKNAIATIYDTDTVSIGSKVLEPVIEPVFAGRFNNYFHDEEFEILVDPRSSMVVFTLGTDE